MNNYDGINGLRKNEQYKAEITDRTINYACDSRKLKGGIGSLFHACVNAMEQLPDCLSHIEMSYCTFRFGEIIRRDLPA